MEQIVAQLRTMSVRNSNKQLPVFFAFLCLFSAASYALIIHSRHMDAALSRFTMWCPGFAALCTCLLLRIPVGSLGWSWPAPRFLKLAYFLPLIYAAPVYLITWLAIHGTFSLQSFEATMSSMYGLGHWPVFGTFAVALPLLFTVNVIATCAWALGEELGWRGFLFPRLHQRFGFHGACLISGAIWAVWHFPGLLWADYNVGTNPFFAMSCFTVGVVAMAYIMGYLRLRSGSIWPCVLIHASHNTFVQGIYDQLTAPVGVSKYITSEFGVGLALSIVIAAVVVLSKSRHERGFGQQVATLIHLTVSTLIGTLFGVLFRNERPTAGLGIAWGSLFGPICWYAGVLTFLPLTLVGSLDWRSKAATMLLPSLIGHLLYGAVSASIFLAFERRLTSQSSGATSQQVDTETLLTTSPAPALCLFALGLGVLLPMLLA